MITSDERRKELNVLVGQMRENPSRDWTDARQRAWVLSRMLKRAAQAG